MGRGIESTVEGELCDRHGGRNQRQGNRRLTKRGIARAI